MNEKELTNDKTHKKSRLSTYDRENKILSPPLLRINKIGGGIAPSSWINDRLPNILWGILLRVQCPKDWQRKYAKILEWLSVQKIDDKQKRITHTDISELPIKIKKGFIERIIQTCGKKTFRPLLLIKCLPDYDIWNDAIGLKTREDDWQILGKCIEPMLNHQSQEATDVRWMKVFARIFISHDVIIYDKLNELKNYPYEGDQRTVRPSIRAMEIGISLINDKSSKWCGEFWNYCLTNTECVPMFDPDTLSKQLVKVSSENYQTYNNKISATRLALIEHFHDSIKTTAIDSKFETIFGMAQYAIDNASECLLNRTSTMISGRITVRILLEVYITLKYLISHDKGSECQLWDTYREYGYGQYSLIDSKYKENDLHSSIVHTPLVELVANEEKSVEFTPINLGNWGKLNLRKMSEEVDEKPLYDKYYDYASGFTHANWGAVRESSMQKCLNPLHRLHNIPAWGLLVLPNAYQDITILIDKIIGLVEDQYRGILSKIDSFKENISKEQRTAL